MFKLIPLALSLILAGSGAVALSAPQGADMAPRAAVQAEAAQYSQDSSEFFLKADTNANMDGQALLNLDI